MFRDKASKAQIIFEKIKRHMVENLYINGGITNPKDQGDNIIFKNWRIKGNDIIQANPREEVRWECPPRGWMKINFDGASKGNPGTAGCGVVLRDEGGI